MTVSDSAIFRIWEQHRPTMGARLDVLDRAVADLGAGVLAPGLEAEAAEAAHKLAGSVGSFGYTRASELAREAEALLRGESADRAEDLAALVAGMRDDMGLEVVVATTIEEPPSATLPVILFATANREALESLRTQAGRRGLRASAVSNLTEVLRRVESDLPEAVVVDLNCPGADAIAPPELIAQLGEDRPALPVLTIGGDDSFAQRAGIAAAGAAGYLESEATPAEQMDQVMLTLQRRAVTGTRVLLASGDRDVQAAVRTALIAELDGAELQVIDDPAAFWEELNRINPSLVLLDARTDGMDAAAASRIMRNDRRWAVVPIVVIVDDADAAPASAALAAGADDCVAAGAGETELVARVCSRVERFRVHQALAETDMLTGLANRRTATGGLGHLIRLAERLNKPLCLTEIDIDHFKKVNDRYGHIAGDTALRRIGELLRRHFRGEDIVARWGGEEFVVGIFGLERDGGIDRVAELLSQWRAETFDFGGEEVHLTFSAGVAAYPADGTDLEQLFSAADQALYAAKSGGRDQVVGSGSGRRTTQQVDVAIVEDEEAASELIATGLEARGHRCWRFSNGAGALEMLGGDHPRVRARVILLDLQLPAVGGMELLAVLGRDDVLRSTRVIVVSATDFPQVMAQARQLGAHDYVVKPVMVDELAERVEAALGRRVSVP